MTLRLMVGQRENFQAFASKGFEMSSCTQRQWRQWHDMLIWGMEHWAENRREETKGGVNAYKRRQTWLERVSRHTRERTRWVPREW
jgi:hypothetical protein